MSDDIVDVVAEALANSSGARKGVPQITGILKALPERMREIFRDDARAAIEAYRRSPLTAEPGEGWREGVEAAAKEAERWAGIWSEPSNVTKALPEISKSFVRAAECITDAIRALPSPPVQPPADEATT